MEHVLQILSRVHSRGPRMASQSGCYVLFADFEVNNEKDNSQHHADGAHDQVGNAQERVLATQPGGCGQGHALFAIKVHHGEGCKHTPNATCVVLSEVKIHMYTSLLYLYLRVDLLVFKCTEINLVQ